MLHRFVLLGLMSLLPACALGGGVSAHVSQTHVAQGEPFQLELEARDGVQGYPDLTPLNRDFRIVARRQNHSVRITNGDVQRHSTLMLTLVPTHAGRLQIPAISIGKAHTQPIGIEVTDGIVAPVAPTADRAFIETLVIPPHPAVGQPIALHVRILSPHPWLNGRFSTAHVSPRGTAVRPAGERRYVVNAQGRPWMALEQVFFLYPKAKGHLHIDPITFTHAPAYDAGRRPGAAPDPVQSPPIEIDVGPAMAAVAPYPPSAMPFRAPMASLTYAPAPMPFPVQSPPRSHADSDSPGLPMWVALLLVSGWLTAPVLWAWRRWGRPVHLRLPALKVAAIERYQVRRRLERAYGRHDAEGARDALLEWANKVWPAHPPVNLNRLAERCPDDLAQAIRVLEASFYGRGSTPWFDAPIGKLLRRFSAGVPTAKTARTPVGLQPLNPAYSSNSP